MKLIASAFVKAQKGFAPALKTNTNPHFKSKYVGLDGCVEAVIDSLNSNGIALIQNTHESESGVIVETIFLHESGEMISAGKLHVPAAKQDPQGYGSALTYARRYSLMAACGIAPEDDDGNAGTAARNAIQKAARPVTADVWDSLPQDERDFLQGIALDVISLLDENRTADAVKLIDGKQLDADEKVALWSRFNSSQRSAMKKEAQKPTPADYINTP